MICRLLAYFLFRIYVWVWFALTLGKVFTVYGVVVLATTLADQSAVENWKLYALPLAYGFIAKHARTGIVHLYRRWYAALQHRAATGRAG